MLNNLHPFEGVEQEGRMFKEHKLQRQDDKLDIYHNIYYGRSACSLPLIFHCMNLTTC